MSCPTCGHTLAYLSDNVMHCERCGTAVQTILGNVYVPKLVERCREFRTNLDKIYLSSVAANTLAELRSQWHALGIAESITAAHDLRGLDDAE